MGSRRSGESRIRHVIRAGALLAAGCILQAKAYAQSFDCSKASTAIEHAICDDKDLRERDEALARNLKTALTAVPDRRQLLLADQRRWLAYRDKRCRDDSPISECLTRLYYARVTHLQAAATPSAAICQRVADGHRLVGNARPAQYSYETTFSWTDDPLSQLNKWAKAQEPPIVIGPELQDALKNIAEETGTIGELGKLPGRELYSMTHEQGSAHCLTSQFFTVEHGYARPVAGPGILGGSPGASCGAGRSFARLDGIPVLVQNKSDEHSPSLSTTEIIVTWDENLAASGCVLTFSHAPKFGRATYDEKETCEGAACDGLRAAARELVEAVQKSPKKTRERLQNRLTEAQRAEYEAAVEPLIRQRGRASEDDPAEITDFVPMLLPYVYGGKVYVASLGHFKPYGDTFADWSVKLESFAEGKPVHSAMFAVGMAKGELEDISISLSGGPER